MAATFILAAVVFALALIGMSVGVIVSSRRLKGSCGGLAGLRDERGQTLCEACDNPAPDCSGDPRERFAGAGDGVHDRNDAEHDRWSVSGEHSQTM